VTRYGTAKLRAYPALAAVGLIAALAVGRPELAALAAPFALYVAVGLLLARPPELRVVSDLDRERQLEGEPVTADLDVSAGRTVGRLVLHLDLESGLTAEGPNPRQVLVEGGGRHSAELPIRCARWGVYEVGETVWRAEDSFGLFVFEGTSGASKHLKVYPAGESLTSLLRPLETQLFAGNQVARERGEGIEFADLRPFMPGDRVRRVNWRATARRNAPWVNETHPERSSDVVIFLDTFAEARRHDLGTLDLAVRAAGSLALHYLREKDRVGLVSFGGVLNWLTASSGLTQLYRVVDSLLDAEIVLSYAWKGIGVLPPRTLPPRALVLALSPLLDERSVTSLLDLRARGFDLAIIDVSPLPFTEPGRGEPEQLAYRLWQLRRDGLRTRYAALGVPVVEWREDVPLQAVLEGVRGFRRHARFVRA
jgi:uncharacterized protein (DUF58 family)